MNKAQGFLIVLKDGESYPRANIRYRGVDRLPAYRLANQDPIDTEIEAMERYVFGDVRDEESGLITSHKVATNLLKAFRSSPREFEPIWCCCVDNVDRKKTCTSRAAGEQLGFDVAGITGDCWSIVADIVSVPETFDFCNKLNENGLFDDARDAWDYLNEYRRLKLHDHDLPFLIIEVHSVSTL